MSGHFSWMIILCTSFGVVACKKQADTKEFPNDKTTYLTIETQLDARNQKANEALFDYLNKEWRKSNFKVEDTRTEKTWSISDCEHNQILTFNGNGIKRYYVKLQKIAGIKKDYYPKFEMYMFDFKTHALAEKAFPLFRQAHLSNAGGYEILCNGKGAHRLVMKGNQIFYFETGAHIFIPDIIRYSDVIAGYKAGD